MCYDFFYAALGTKMEEKGKINKTAKCAIETKKGNMAQIVGMLGRNIRQRDCLWDEKPLNFSFKMCYVFVVENLVLIEMQAILEISSGNPSC